MKLLNELWHDEAGVVVSAELVLLGTLGVVGVGVGAAAVGNSVESELAELSLSLRSLDQSYHIQGFQGCGAWTAGSCYTQPPVEESRAELQRNIERNRATQEEQVRDAERSVEGRDERPQDDDRSRERRPRMRERELEQRDGERNDRWDGDDRRERDESQADE